MRHWWADFLDSLSFLICKFLLDLLFSLQLLPLHFSSKRSKFLVSFLRGQFQSSSSLFVIQGTFIRLNKGTKQDEANNEMSVVYLLKLNLWLLRKLK